MTETPLVLEGIRQALEMAKMSRAAAATAKAAGETKVTDDYLAGMDALIADIEYLAK